MGKRLTPVGALTYILRTTTVAAMSITKTRRGTFEVRWRDKSGRHRSRSFKRRGLAAQFDRAIQEEVTIERGAQTLIDEAFPGNHYVVVHDEVLAECAEMLNAARVLQGDLAWIASGEEREFEDEPLPPPTHEEAINTFFDGFDVDMVERVLRHAEGA